MSELSEIKKDIITDITSLINHRMPISGEVLPPNPLRIEVVGKNKDDLQVRVIYKDQAPFYFRRVRES
jgi:hypothetical protein